MRYGADEGASQLVDLLEHSYSHGLLAQLRPLEGDGEVVAEGSQQPFGIGLDLETHETEQTDRAVRRGEGEGGKVVDLSPVLPPLLPSPVPAPAISEEGTPGVGVIWRSSSSERTASGPRRRSRAHGRSGAAARRPLRRRPLSPVATIMRSRSARAVRHDQLGHLEESLCMEPRRLASASARQRWLVALAVRAITTTNTTSGTQFSGRPTASV